MKFKPLRDHIVVKPEAVKTQTDGGIFIPDAAMDKPIRGEVLAVGTGEVQADNTIRPMGLKVGDVGLFHKEAGIPATIEGMDVLLMREADILGTIE